MVLDVPGKLGIGLVISLIAGTETAPCPSGTVAINVASSADLRSFIDGVDCTGEAIFDVTWYSSLQIDESIAISDQKSVTVTGNGFPTIQAGVTDDDDDTDPVIDIGSTTGIFSVQNGSTLVLKQWMLDGGRSRDGGAVAVTSSSSLYVHDCAFTNNNATKGGENKV